MRKSGGQFGRAPFAGSERGVGGRRYTSTTSQQSRSSAPGLWPQWNNRGGLRRGKASRPKVTGSRSAVTTAHTGRPLARRRPDLSAKVGRAVRGIRDWDCAKPPAEMNANRGRSHGVSRTTPRPGRPHSLVKAGPRLHHLARYAGTIPVSMHWPAFH